MRANSIDMMQRRAAIIAGAAIVIMALAAVVANDLTINRLVVTDNAPATWKNLMNSSWLFRTGIFAWLIILICDALAAWGLYLFFKPVNKNLSLLMAWFRIIYVAILGTSMMNLLYVLQLISDPAYLSAIGAEHAETQVLFYMNAFYNEWSFGLVVFGIHILLLGYLLIKSGYRVKIIGVILIIAFMGYTLIHVSKLLVQQYEKFIEILEWVFLLPMLGEVALGIWLLVKSRAQYASNQQ
jgi:hypothetical protein